MPSITLLTLGTCGEERPGWSGPQQVVEPDPAAVARALQTTSTDAVLCLDRSLPLPEAALLDHLLAGPGDAWHGGLRLSGGARPTALDHVKPQWFFAAPTDGERAITSHLLSLRALLVRTEVLAQLGGPLVDLDTLAGAGFELGIRWLRAGALVRHEPGLAPREPVVDGEATARDELLAVTRHQGRLWGTWALVRSVQQRTVPWTAAPGLTRDLWRHRSEPVPHYTRSDPGPPGAIDRTVSVILPTVDRYPYLVPLLGQLARQSVPPHEVLVVDQTPAARRHDDLDQVAPGLEVRVSTLDAPGQSTARNLALRSATGELVLFIDDDDEIPDDLIERHLTLLTDGIDAICGAVDDATAGPPPAGFRHRRASDVFPTNNTMLRRASLAGSGLFDPAYDRGSRADHDLGMRLHLSGAVLVYDPSVSVFHHHAPQGGLRTHGARRVTRASARRSLTERHLPSVTELYAGLRYFTAEQCREGRLIRLVSTLSSEGTATTRTLRGAVQAILLPSTIARLRRTEREARDLLARRPAIPRLEPGDAAVAGADVPWLR